MASKTHLSPSTIQALVEVISGGSGNSEKTPIGLYRTGPAIERFMRACNVDFILSGSRCPSLELCLINLNNGVNGNQVVTDDKLITTVIESAADPRDFIETPDKGKQVLEYLNKYLLYDGLELQPYGLNIKLVKAGQKTSVISELSQQAAVVNFDTVQYDIDRALKSADIDPEDAITAACCCVESVCRSILAELGVPLPSKEDLKGLYRTVAIALGLMPDGLSDLSSEVKDDVRKVLSGMFTLIEGIGSLRTRSGDAHGRKRGTNRVDARISRLAIHSASTISLFLIETWQKKFPTRILHNVQAA